MITMLVPMTAVKLKKSHCDDYDACTTVDEYDVDAGYTPQSHVMTMMLVLLTEG